MDIGSTNRPRSMVAQRSSGGLGFRNYIKNHFNDVTPLDEIFLAQASCSSLLLKPLAQVSGPSLLLEFLRGSTCLMAENLPAWATQQEVTRGFHFVFLTMDEYRNRYMVLTEMERWRRIAKRCHLRPCNPNRGQSVTNIISHDIYIYLYIYTSAGRSIVREVVADRPANRS